MKPRRNNFIKAVFIFCLVLICDLRTFSQAWTNDQLEQANTAASIDDISDEEKAAIQYINLCRLYPKQFITNELQHYNGIPGILKNRSFAKYKASLIKELNRRKPCNALEFDEAMYEDADCYSYELSKNKRKPHQRIDCEKHLYAECVFFGSGKGRYIAIEWLIDSGIENLGHRKNCLNTAFARTGISIATHFEYDHCAVAEFAE